MLNVRVVSLPRRRTFSGEARFGKEYLDLISSWSRARAREEDFVVSHTLYGDFDRA